MELKKAQHLRSLDYNKQLQEPRFLNVFNKEKRNEIHNLEYNIAITLLRDDNMLNLKKRLAKSPLVKLLKGRGTVINPFYMETEFAKGYFFNVDFLFAKRKWTQIAVGTCFSNAYKTALGLSKNSIENKILNGLSWFGYSVCHSINLVNDEWVIDYNFGVVMQKELYFKTFPFEVLDAIDGKEILNNYDQFKKYYISDFEKCFCYDVVANQIRNGEIEVRDREDKLFFSTTKYDIKEVYQERFEAKFRWPNKLNKRKMLNSTINKLAETEDNEEELS